MPGIGRWRRCARRHLSRAVSWAGARRTGTDWWTPGRIRTVRQAAWGKRLQRLDPEPVTAAHVRWMFARRLAGRSLAGIARELNERGVLCPSVGDPERNRNRLGGMWSGPTVGAILANPRYTGREVWNRRQATDRTGRSTVVGECVVSKAVTHPALVSEADFVAAQRVRAERAIGDGGRRRYLLHGLLRCGH